MYIQVSDVTAAIVVFCVLENVGHFVFVITMRKHASVCARMCVYIL